MHKDSPKISGKLEVISGAMFSGKSEELIRQLVRHQIAGRHVIAFKPIIDSRYSTAEIVSHSGSKFDCIPISNSDTRQIASYSDYDVLAFDEAQFFAAYFIVPMVNWLLEKNKIIIVAGLDKTFRAEPFGAMGELLALADYVTKLTAICHKCGNEATMTQRLIDGEPAPFSGETIQVGGLESYEARCRQCFEVK